MMIVFLSMGNCFSIKRKKRSVSGDHPTVSKWLASCDFSSVPNIDERSVRLSQNSLILGSVLGVNLPDGDDDGYTTALENLEGGDGECDNVIRTESSSSIGSQKRCGSPTLIDEGSVYETSDELLLNELGPVLEAVLHPASFVQNNGRSCEHNDSDVVEDLIEWERNYDARPICPLPTPLRKNLISPRVNIETLVDRKGRVRRTERVKLYLDQIRQAAQHL